MRSMQFTQEFVACSLKRARTLPKCPAAMCSLLTAHWYARMLFVFGWSSLLADQNELYSSLVEGDVSCKCSYHF